MRRVLMLAVVLVVFIPSTTQAAGTGDKAVSLATPTEAWEDGSYGQIDFFRVHSSVTDDVVWKSDLEFEWSGVLKEFGDEPMRMIVEEPAQHHQRGLRRARLTLTTFGCVDTIDLGESVICGDLVIRLRIEGFGAIQRRIEGNELMEIRQGHATGQLTVDGYVLPGSDFTTASAWLSRERGI